MGGDRHFIGNCIIRDSQQVPQLGFGAGQSAHDGSDRHIQQVGNFSIGAVLKVKHQQHHFEICAQRVDGCLQFVAIDRSFARGLGDGIEVKIIRNWQG